MIRSIEIAPVNTTARHDYASVISMTFLSDGLYHSDVLLCLGETLPTDYLKELTKYIVVEEVGGIKFTHLLLATPSSRAKQKAYLVSSKAHGYPTIRYIDAIRELICLVGRPKNFDNSVSLNKLVLDLYFRYTEDPRLEQYIRSNPHIANYIGVTDGVDTYGALLAIHEPYCLDEACSTEPDTTLLNLLYLSPYEVMYTSHLFRMGMTHRPYIADIQRLRVLAKAGRVGTKKQGFIPYEEMEEETLKHMVELMDILTVADTNREITTQLDAAKTFANELGMESTGELYVKPYDVVYLDSNKGPMMLDLGVTNLLAPSMVDDHQFKKIMNLAN